MFETNKTHQGHALIGMLKTQQQLKNTTFQLGKTFWTIKIL